MKGKTLHTVATHKPFKIIEVPDTKCVIYVESTGKMRLISKTEFERAAGLGPVTSLNTVKLRQSGASEVNPANTLAILTTIAEIKQ